MLHRFRCAISNAGHDMLSGHVEIDETVFGGVRHGKRGRGAEGNEPHFATSFDQRAESVEVKLTGLTSPRNVYIERIDDDHANAKRLWIEMMGKPALPTERESNSYTLPPKSCVSPCHGNMLAQHCI